MPDARHADPSQFQLTCADAGAGLGAGAGAGEVGDVVVLALPPGSLLAHAASARLATMTAALNTPTSDQIDRLVG